MSGKPKSDDEDQELKEELLDVIARDKQIIELLASVQKTVQSAPALNGGFDRLVAKVDKIDVTQQQLVQKVDQVHECLYEPDEGLYTRIRDIDKWRLSQVESAKEVKQGLEDIRQLKTWRENIESQEAKTEKKIEKREEELDQALEELRDLKKWKDNASKFFWLIGASSAGVFIKAVWDIVGNHVAFK